MRTGLLAVLVLGCASDGIGEVGQGPDVAMYEGEITADRTEIGLVSLGSHRCAGVLVAPYAVLTDAACLGRLENPSDLGSFSPGLGSAVGRAFAIDTYYGVEEKAERGLILAHLAEAVPASAAVPARLSLEPPRAGETVARFGFDCLVHGPVDSNLTKRKYYFGWGDDVGACPSGVTLRGDGRVVQIEDGALADVVDAVGLLHDQILAWPAPLEAGDASGLLAWLRFDAGYVTGPEGPAASFEGDDVVERPRPLLGHRTSWTFAAWIRPAGMGGILYSEGEPRPTLNIVLREDGGLSVGSFHVDGGEWLSASSSAGIVPLSEWTHVAISLDHGGAGAGMVRFYVNGQLVDTDDGQASVSPWTVFATIGDNVGAYHGGGEARAAYLGDLDEVRFYDRAVDVSLLRALNNSAARP